MALYGGILGLALLARFVWLDSLPGVNGDEAWFGLWVEGLLRDHVWGGMTPSGPPPNPFLVVPLAILQAIADPAPWVLRFPTVISDVAFIVVGYAGLRSTIGKRPALVFALLAATTPITLIYSRFGWDPSQTPLAAMIFLWACLAGRRVVAVLSLCAAILVHPTNVFLFPILVAFWFKYVRSFLAKITGNVGSGALFSAMLIGVTLTRSRFHSGQGGRRSENSLVVDTLSILSMRCFASAICSPELPYTVILLPTVGRSVSFFTG